MTFLEKLDLLISSRGMNKHSFAKECGIPYTTIDYWYKKNTDKVKLDTVRQISDFFGVSLNYWKEDEENPLNVYADYIEFLPFLAQADSVTLENIRAILHMSAKKICSESTRTGTSS